MLNSCIQLNRLQSSAIRAQTIGCLAWKMLNKCKSLGQILATLDILLELTCHLRLPDLSSIHLHHAKKLGQCLSATSSRIMSMAVARCQPLPWSSHSLMLWRCNRWTVFLEHAVSNFSRVPSHQHAMHTLHPGHQHPSVPSNSFCMLGIPNMLAVVGLPPSFPASSAFPFCNTSSIFSLVGITVCCIYLKM